MKESKEIVNKALVNVLRRRLNEHRRINRARCFICKERCHVFTVCPNKSVSKHVDSKFGLDNESEFVVVGTENMGWDDIWYVSKSNTKHLSGSRESFENFQPCYSFETRNDNLVDLIIYGIGEVKITMNEKDTRISCVSYGLGYGKNVLSFEHLLWQGFKVKFMGEKCEITCMFDDKGENSELT
ncbi:hypothetical protein R6Q57_020425 [Mikania cordata]